MSKKIILKAVVFVMVTIATAFLVNKINNRNINNVSREIEEPTQDIVYMSFGGIVCNPLKGYKQVMSTELMRESIVPLSDDKIATVLVDEDTEFVKCSYELRSISGDNLIEQGDMVEGSKVDGFIPYSVSFRMDLRENQEYVMVFILENEQAEKIRYYTRVVRLKENYANQMMIYARDFHDVTFEKNVNEKDGNMVYDLLETTPEETTGDLSHVNLNSSYLMVSWGGMTPLVLTGIVPTIKEVDTNAANISFSYIVQTVDGDTNHYYNVDEYYNIEFDKNTGELNLLSFDRYQSSYFDSEYINKEKNALSLGICDKNDYDYATTEDGKKIAFAKEGQLWLYDYDSSKIVSVFDFLNNEYSDVRCVNTDVDVNIINMDNDGNMYFAVYGYMNRGKHEGENGVALYRYDASEYHIEEMLFVSVDEPYDVMKKEIGKFAYYDNAGNFYYLLNGCIYKVNTDTMELETIASGINSDKYKVSRDGNKVAYPNSNIEQDVTAIIIHNFETGEEITKTGSQTDRFLAQGYVGNDLIYGVSAQGDISIASDGSAILPLYKLFIIDPAGEVLKEYSKSGIYIMEAEVLDDTIYLKRGVKQNSFFGDCEPDFISYKAEDDGKKLTETTFFSDIEYTQRLLVLPSDMYISKSLSRVMTKDKTSENYNKLSVETKADLGSYYVFDNSGYGGEYACAGKAILAANASGRGIVVDCNGNTVYKTVDKTSYNTVADSIKEVPCVNPEDSWRMCAYMCIDYAGYAPEQSDIMACSSWEEAFENYTYGVGINVSGIDLDTALYFLDRDVPFMARIDDGRYVLVISYNSTHIRYYDPIAGGEIKVTKKEFKNSLSLYGNTIYTYTSQ